MKDKRQTLITVALMLAVLLLSLSQAKAYRCAPVSYEEQYKASPLIFAAKVTEVKGVERSREGWKVYLQEITFEVEHVWKGRVPATQAKIIAHPASYSTGYKFDVGSSYVFSTKFTEPLEILTGCSDSIRVFTEENGKKFNQLAYGGCADVG